MVTTQGNFPEEVEQYKEELQDILNQYQEESVDGIKGFVGQLYKQEEDKKAREDLGEVLEKGIEKIDKRYGHEQSEIIDQMLGINKKEGEKEYKGEQTYQIETSYDTIKQMLDKTGPRQEETFYDLGSGYSRVLITGSLLTDAEYRGIELVKERVDESKRIRDRLGLENVEIMQGDVKELKAEELSDGDFFYMFKPFSVSTFKEFGKTMEELAERKDYTVIGGGQSNKWLKVIDTWDFLEEKGKTKDRKLGFYKASL
ncbi:MAG: methyltransferase domain-containing protein [Candidatus Nanohaloarchaeota archaeon QJJ-9]|nr:methyltransferase domain-containing protein [Candidatus Nanohaloarchaeota archaeon QJJ-9]